MKSTVLWRLAGILLLCICCPDCAMRVAHDVRSHSAAYAGFIIGSMVFIGSIGLLLLAGVLPFSSIDDDAEELPWPLNRW